MFAPPSTAVSVALCGAAPSTRTTRVLTVSQRPVAPGCKGSTSTPTGVGASRSARAVKAPADGPACSRIGRHGSTAAAATGRASSSLPINGGKSSRARKGAPVVAGPSPPLPPP